jgi:hypothetical protein
VSKDTTDRAKSPDRRARLAAALKANIGRRKAAAKEADGGAPATPGAGGGSPEKPDPSAGCEAPADGGSGGGD